MAYLQRERAVARAAIVLSSVLFSSFALANHGPGASGGGSFTISGETLKPGQVEVEVREDATKFEHFTVEEAKQRVMGTDDFDSLDHGFITTVSASVGIIENLQIGTSFGYFVGNQFVGATDLGNGSTEASETNQRFH